MLKKISTFVIGLLMLPHEGQKVLQILRTYVLLCAGFWQTAKLKTQKCEGNLDQSQLAAAPTFVGQWSTV